MTRLHKEWLTCPECFHDEDTTVWDSISLQEDPDLKEEMYKKKIQCFYCNNCQATYLLDHSFVVHDEKEGFFLYYAPKLAKFFEKRVEPIFHLERETLKELPEATQQCLLSQKVKARICLTYNDLIEKLHLFDHHFDDRLVELLKIAWKMRLLDEENIRVLELYFVTGNDEKMIFQMCKEGEAGEEVWESIELATELYINAEAQLSTSLPEEKGLSWIQKDWAIHFIQEQGK